MQPDKHLIEGRVIDQVFIGVSFNPTIEVSKMSDRNSLKNYMSSTQRMQLGDRPTTHRNCIDACGVARPGKTKRDRAKKGL